ncbi:MAG: efflux RND transporter periplasmic adaptor subunit [bacterium]
MNKKQRILLAVGILALLLAGWSFVRSRPHDLILIGVVDADETVVIPPVQARIDSLWVEEGSEVKAGQVLATLDRRELAAQAQSADASTASMRAQLDQSAVLAQQSAGETESALAGARARLASARADLARQDAELTRLRADAGRASKLAESGGISPSELERSTTSLRVQEQVLAAATQSLKAAEADVRRAEAGELGARAARGSVVATRARLQGAKADSAAASARLGYTELRAPVNGVVQVLAARRGELVGPGSPVVVLVNIDRLWVRVAAPESDADGVAVGDSLEVRLPSGATTRGRVISKSAEGEFATQHDVSASKRDIRAVAFRVAIANPKHVIVPGMTASVVLPPSHK